MRPCTHCGEPIRNNQKFCENCKKKLEATSDNLDSRLPAAPKTARVTTFTLFLFLAEMVLTALILAIPLGVICSIVTLFFVPDWRALKIGFGFGLIGGMVYWAAKTYLFSQATRRRMH